MALPPDFSKALDVLIKPDLTTSRDMFFDWLLVATGIVALGLLFELPELLFDIFSIGRRQYNKYALHITFPEEHVPDWRKVVAFIGWLLIVFGVMGEFVMEAKVKETDALLESINSEMLEDSRTQAIANERENIELRKELNRSDANLTAKQIGLEIEERKTAEAQTKASEAHAKELEEQKQLNEFLVKRSFPRQLRIDLAGLLGSLPPAKAEIWFQAGDSGSLILASDIQANLLRAHWDVPQLNTPVAPEQMVKELAFGVQIVTNRVSFLGTQPTCPFEMAKDMATRQGLAGNDAIKFALLCAATGAQSARKDSTLPDNFFRILVGQRGPDE